MGYNGIFVAYICTICFCAAKVDWMIKEQLTAYGQDLELVCTGDNCCNTSILKRWHGGSKDKLLMLENGESTDKAKYSTAIFRNKFVLTIKNITEADLNVVYKCSNGFDMSEKNLLTKNDVFKPSLNVTPFLNDTRKGDQEIIDDNAPVLAGTVSGAVVIIILVVIAIYICMTKNKKKERRNNGEPHELQHLDPEDNKDVTDTATDKGTSSGYSTDEDTKVMSPVSAEPQPTSASTLPPDASSSISTSENTAHPDEETVTKQNIDRDFQYSLENEHQSYNAHGKCRFPSYKEMETRKKSFTQNFVINTDHMASAGFFYSGCQNYAKCFYCGFQQQWRSKNDPFHKTSHRDNCRYIEQMCHGKGDTEVGEGQSGTSGNNSTYLANTGVVSLSSAKDQSTVLHSSEGQHLLTARQNKKTSDEKASFGSVLCIRDRLKRQGISDSTTNIILQSWRKSTEKQYGTYYRKWMLFSNQKDFDPLNPPTVMVLDFLTELFNSNVGYSAINTAKSAIASITSLVSGRNIGNEEIIRRFMRGIFNTKPSLPRYTNTWDVNIVLSYIELLPNNEDLTLLQLSQKLATLLMILSGQRCQTIHLITLENITIDSDKMICYIADLVKQSRPGKHVMPLEFNRYNNHKLCVVRTLQDYVDKTSSIRKKENKLFISCVKPHKTITKSTVSRWVKTLMEKAGVNVNIYGTHSCRAASTSSGLQSGIPIDIIMKSAGWSSAQTFYKFYFKNVPKHQTLSESILSNSKKKDS